MCSDRKSIKVLLFKGYDYASLFNGVVGFFKFAAVNGYADEIGKRRVGAESEFRFCSRFKTYVFTLNDRRRKFCNFFCFCCTALAGEKFFSALGGSSFAGNFDAVPRVDFFVFLLTAVGTDKLMPVVVRRIFR